MIKIDCLKFLLNAHLWSENSDKNVSEFLENFLQCKYLYCLNYCYIASDINYLIVT